MVTLYWLAVRVALESVKVATWMPRFGWPSNTFEIPFARTATVSTVRSSRLSSRSGTREGPRVRREDRPCRGAQPRHNVRNMFQLLLQKGQERRRAREDVSRKALLGQHVLAKKGLGDD